MNQHIVALLMLFSNITHAKAPDTVGAQQAAQARAAHELKVEAYQACLSAGRVQPRHKVRGASAKDGSGADCVDPGPYVALSGTTPAAPAGDKARPVLARAASKS